MRPMRALVVFSTLALLAGSCQITSFGVSVPAQVATDSVFAIEIAGFATNLPMLLSTAAVVAQLPAAFQVVGGVATVSGGGSSNGLPDGGRRDHPPLLAAYAAEPNHYLASFDGWGGGPQGIQYAGELKVYLRAPSLPGSYVLKFACGTIANAGMGVYRPQQPTTTNFAAIVGVPFAQTVQVVAGVQTPLEVVSADFWSGADLPTQVTTVDFDGDGRDDVAQSVSNGLRAHLSKPAGWVDITGNLAAVSSPGAIFGGDFDGDGFGDLLVYPGQVIFGGGGPQWTIGQLLPHGFTAPSIDVGDVNGDGLSDVVCSSGGTCLVFRGNRNRTFSPFGTGLPSAAPGSFGSVAVVDLERDHIAEIVLWSQPQTSVWRTDGTGNWFSVGTLPAPPLSSGTLFPYAFIDLDGDRDLEVITVGSGVAHDYVAHTLVAISVTPVPFAQVTVIDYDRDGNDDLLFSRNTNFGPGTSPDLWQGLGGGVFQSIPLPVEHGIRRAVVNDWTTGDFDGDAFSDVAAALANERLMVWRTSAAGATTFGDACSTAGFVAPQLSVQGTVSPGQGPLLRLTGAQPNGLACFWVGADKRTLAGQPVLPLDLGAIGAPGCHQYTEALVLVFVVADASGMASIPIPLPSLPPTVSLAVFTQGGVLAPGANALQALFSSALALRVQ